MIRGLEDGSLGYTEVFRARTPVPAWALLQYETPFRGTSESVLTNLDKVNPEMLIYRRNGSESLGREVFDVGEKKSRLSAEGRQRSLSDSKH